jgi:hypothetical protein
MTDNPTETADTESTDDQQTEVESPHEGIDKDKSASANAEPTNESDTDDAEKERLGPVATRRGVLTAGTILGLLGLGVGSVSADASGQIGTSNDPLQDLYTANLHGDSGTVVVNDELDLNGNNINNAASIDNGGSAINVDDTLELGGNKIKAGSSSSDVVIQADDGSNPGNILMGRSNNSLGSSIIGAVISGGGADGNINEVKKSYGTIGGGKSNLVGGEIVSGSGEYGTIPGGIFCQVNGDYGFAVGYGCKATAESASAVGGRSNEASSAKATVAGGEGNEASANYAFVAGGRWNEAGGQSAFAAGAYARAADDNSFVWNDGSGASDSSGAGGNNADKFKSSTTAGSTPTGAETFSVKAKGGIRFITSGDNSSHAWVDTSGNLKASGNVDAQGGTVENTSGALSLSTGSSDLSLKPAGNIDVNSNRISNAKEIHSDNNNITLKGSADINLDGTRLTEKGGDMNIISVNSVNVDIDSDNNDTDGTRDFNVTKDGGSTSLFTVNDGGQVDIFQGDLDMNSSGNVVNTSDARVKTAIEPIAHPIEKLTELEPRTYEWKAEEAADGREAGVIAQSVEDVLPEAVQEDEDGFLQLAYRQLTPLVIGAVQDQQDEIERLEADLDDRDDRIDDLEAANVELRERNAELEDRLATVEAELGIDATASQQGIADD